MKSALKSVCSEKLIDLRIAKKKASRILGQSSLIPIYISSDELLMPIRIRRPRISRDGGYGYVNFMMIGLFINQLTRFCDDKNVRAALTDFGIPENYVVCGSAVVGFNSGSIPNAAPRNEETVDIVR